MKEVKVKINEDEFNGLLSEALEEGLDDSDIEYPYPNCGKAIIIRSTSNECECGFILNVQVG